MGIIKSCCFFGHRKIKDENIIKKRVRNVVECLIDKGASVFVFGSKSEFNSLCYAVVTELKQHYTHIERVYVRAEYPYIDSDYELYLLGLYEKTYYPESIIGAGKAVYIERNKEMVDISDCCVVYYDKPSDCLKTGGTGKAYDYAQAKHKWVINVAMGI